MIVKLNLIRNKSAPHFYQFKLILISYRPTSVASISQSFLLEFKTCLADIHGVYAMCMILRCALKPLPNYNNSLAHIASIIVAYLLIIPEPGCCLRLPRLGAWPPPSFWGQEAANSSAALQFEPTAMLMHFAWLQQLLLPPLVLWVCVCV